MSFPTCDTCSYNPERGTGEPARCSIPTTRGYLLPACAQHDVEEWRKRLRFDERGLPIKQRGQCPLWRQI